MLSGIFGSAHIAVMVSPFASLSQIFSPIAVDHFVSGTFLTLETPAVFFAGAFGFVGARFLAAGFFATTI